MQNLFHSNTRRLCGCQLFLGGIYLIRTDIAMCDTADRIQLSSCYTNCLDVELSYLLHLYYGNLPTALMSCWS